MNYHDRTFMDSWIRWFFTSTWCQKIKNRDSWNDSFACVELEGIHGRDMDADIQEWD